MTAAGCGWPTACKRPGTSPLDLLAAGVPVLVEERVAMRRELSALVARSPFGQGAAWPVVETVQRDGICVQVIAPAPKLPDALGVQAQQLAFRLAAELGVVGVLAVQLFGTADGELLVNELAMRPHNSGHWTMDGLAPASSSSICGRCSIIRSATPTRSRRSP